MSAASGFLPEGGDDLRAAIGRPRTALWVGGEHGAELAREVGATVTVAAGPGDIGAQRIDLAFVTAGAAADLERVLPRVAPLLEDGGHVAVQPSPSVGEDAIAARLGAAGLALLWRRSGALRTRALSQSPVLVARRPPERRKLSLTVGMISMNEQGAVGGVIEDIRRAAPEAEILLVDSSKDETPVIAERLGARVIRQFPPRGYGPAMTRLLYSATTDVVLTMDCDGTYPADRILDLHGRVEQGADLVNASRTHHRPPAMPLANYVANRAFALAAGLVHGFATTDVHSGMRAYRTSMLRGMWVPEKGAALPVGLIAVPARHGYRVENVDIDYRERIGRTTLNRFDSTMWTARRVVHSALAGGRAVR